MRAAPVNKPLSSEGLHLSTPWLEEVHTLWAHTNSAEHQSRLDVVACIVLFELERVVDPDEFWGDDTVMAAARIWAHDTSVTVQCKLP